MTAPGDLARRLVLQEPLDTPDGAGGISRSYHDVAVLWAQVTLARAQGDVVADRLRARVTHRIIVRAGPDITVRHRLRDGARIFAVAALRDVDVPRRYVEILAEELAD